MIGTPPPPPVYKTVASYIYIAASVVPRTINLTGVRQEAAELPNARVVTRVPINRKIRDDLQAQADGMRSYSA